MLILKIVTASCLILGLFIIFDISPARMLEDFMVLRKPKDPTLYDLVRFIRKKKEKKGLKKLWEETQDILIATNRQDKLIQVAILSGVLSLLGLFFALLLRNGFLMPIFMGGFGLMPFWYVRFIAIKWRKELNAELETSLSIITTSYLRSDSIITAIEENVHYINPPLQDIFRGFLTQSLLINANLKLALRKLKSRVDSPVFGEWVDALMACQEDKNLKSTLVPIVSKLSDMRIVTAELDYLLYEPVKEFVTMAILMVANIPLIYVLNKDWYEALLFTLPGKCVLAICAGVLFYSMGRVVRLTKPVEYQR